LQAESWTPCERSLSPQHTHFAPVCPLRICPGAWAHSDGDGIWPRDRMPPRRIGS
jgi:hypothetical protein